MGEKGTSKRHCSEKMVLWETARKETALGDDCIMGAQKSCFDNNVRKPLSRLDLTFYGEGNTGNIFSPSVIKLRF